MDIKSGNGYPAGTLSNFAPHKFVFRGVECKSMEGFLQSLKFKEPEMQRHVCTLVGSYAKRYGYNKNWWTKQTLWWNGQPINRDSQEYQDLLDEAYDCLFRQNEKARKALIATGKAVLKHSIGKRKKNETILTQQEFCSRLMKMRDTIQAENFLDFGED